MTEIEKIRKWVRKNPDDPAVYLDAVAILYDEIQRCGNARNARNARNELDLDELKAHLHAENKELRKAIGAAVHRGIGNTERLSDTYWKSMLIDAPVDFDAFNLYLEKNIPVEKKIYQPRRKALMPFVTALQDAHEGKLDFISGSVPKRVGKTTIGTRFVLFREGNNPMSSSLCCGSGDTLVKSFYNGMLEVLQDTEKYAFYEIFPDSKLVRTNADEKLLDLQKKTRFASITCRSIDGSLTGNTEANDGGVLYMDDLVANEEEAVNRDRLDFLWNKVTGDLFGRWVGGPIVIFGTRYSLYDPIGMFQEYAESRDWRTKIIEIPALNDEGESNFEMTVEGKQRFTTKYFLDMKAACTEIQWESQYQQRPFEAKGRLFPEDQLNRFFELPERAPDAIVAACDTAEKGSDSVCMPIGYIYGEDVLIADCVFNNATPEHTKPECAMKLVKHKVGLAQFESNSAGEYYASDVEELMKKQGGKTSIRLKRSLAKKTTRVEVESDYILKHFYFLDRSKYKPNDEYGMMIKEMCTYVRSGKVPHDDAVDGMAQLSELIRTMGGGKVEVIRRPF